MTMLQPTFELPGIATSIGPFILPEAFRFPIHILPNIHISILKEIRSIPVPQTTVPLPLILVPVTPDVHPIPFSFAVEPLADVALAVDALPHPVALLGAVFPLTIIDFGRFPRVDAFAVSTAVDILTLI